MQGRQLRPFQEAGVAQGINRRGRTGLFLDMGLGKTPIACKIAAALGWRRIVVCCKDNGVAVWKDIGKKWLEEFTGLPVKLHVMDDSPWIRELEWALATPRDEIHVWIVVYNTFALDMGQRSLTVKRKAKREAKVLKPLQKIIPNMHWDGLIADECRRINSKDSAAFLACYYFVREHCNGFLALSGTPGDKGPQSFWSYLRIIDPAVFKSYWAYIEHFHIVDTNPLGGKEIFDQRLDTKPEWDRVMKKYFYTVKEEDVAGERPEIERVAYPVKMTEIQKKLYQDIKKDMLSILGDSMAFAQNSMVQMLRMRQILVCPKILGDDFDYGGAIEALADELEEANETARHTVIFTPFKAAFPHYTTYLASRGFSEVVHLHGGITPKEQEAAITRFRERRAIAICTILYAEAFSLEPSTSYWFIGLEWSPDNNRQAEKRLLRLTSKEPILGRYIQYDTPTDRRLVEVIGLKQERIDMSLPSTYRWLLDEGDQ